MLRNARQTKILELIEKKDIGTQTELTNELNKEGFAITQATVSRDIKELGLVKVVSSNNKYKYLYPENSNQDSKLLNIFRESVLTIETALNQIVIKTISGSANSACVIIDKLNFSSIVGTLAGDDTIIIIVKTIKDVDEVYRALQTLKRK